MAVWVTAGALLLVLLTGASYGYPAKGFNPSSSYGSSYDTSPGSAGSEVPSSGGYAPGGYAPGGYAPGGYAPGGYAPGGYAPGGYAPGGYAPAGYAPGGYAPAVSDSGAVSTNPGLSQPTPRREASYPQPSARPVAYSSNSFAAPERSGYARSSSVVPSYLQPASSRDIAWAVAPPLPLSGEETSARPSAQSFGPSNVSPPGPGYQAGDLSKYENTYEHGNSESETEEQGFQPTPSGVTVFAREDSSEVNPSGPGSSWVESPFPYDYMFLTGQYPPGTVSHYSSSFEQGQDNWQDTNYVRYYYPAEPSIQQPSQPVKQPSQPVKQPSIGSTSYGQSGAANQPYGGVGLSSSSQPGRLAQPAGGYSLRKGGY